MSTVFYAFSLLIFSITIIMLVHTIFKMNKLKKENKNPKKIIYINLVIQIVLWSFNMFFVSFYVSLYRTLGTGVLGEIAMFMYNQNIITVPLVLIPVISGCLVFFAKKNN